MAYDDNIRRYASGNTASRQCVTKVRILLAPCGRVGDLKPDSLVRWRPKIHAKEIIKARATMGLCLGIKADNECTLSVRKKPVNK